MGQLVDQYVNIRGTQKPGPSRTEAMTQVVAKMISVASQVQSFPIEQSLTNEENAGQRLAAYAYLYAKPDSQFLNHLVKCLTTLENTPFGQYWAIQALDKILALQGLEKTDKDIANQLLSFLRKRLRKGTDRYADLSRILNVQNG
jgi:hypothetical protein